MPSIEQVLIAAAIFVASVIVSAIVNRLIQNASWFTKRTETTLDDRVVKLLARPINLLFSIGGVVLAVYYLFPELTFRGYDYKDLAFVLAAFVITYAIDRLVRGIISWYEEEPKKGDSQGGAIFGFLEIMISILIWGFAVLFVLNHYNVDVTTLFAGLGIAGLAVAFGLQSTFSGIFSAIFLAIDKPVRAGDFVKLDDGSEGFVEDISFRSTRIRTFSGNYIIIPNTKLADMVIINYYQPAQEVGVVIPVGVSYHSDLEKVEKITLKVAKEILKDHEGVKDFEPFVRYNGFGDSSINFNVILRVKKFIDQYVVKHEFIVALKKAYEKEGIEIPFPHLDVHVTK